MSQCAYIVIYMSYCTCSIGGHGALSSERNPVDSYSETNFRLQLSLCGHHDWRSAKPAHHPATAWAGVCVCLCVGNRHLRKDGRKGKTYLIHFFLIHTEYIILSLFLSPFLYLSLVLSHFFLRVFVLVFQGLELCRVIAMHMENMLSVREKRLTLPPSEITLL